MVIDLVFIALSFVWAFYLRFDFSFPSNYLYLFRFWLPIIIIIQLIVFNITGFYQIIWRFTSLWEILTIVKNVTYSFLVGLFFIGLFSKFSYHPGSVLLNFYSFNIIFICISRVSVRLYFSHIQNQSHLKKFHPPKKLLLIGAGKAGAKVANEINNASQSQYEIIGFIDDDIEKQGGLLNGKKIFCGLIDLVNLNVFYDELLITAPNATGDQMRRIVKICKETGKRYKTIPSLNELIDGESHIDAIRDVSYSDLLGRDEVKLDMNSIEDLINGKRVLITGAGGSIGSELVEQCINFQPSEIICLDINEEKIYNLDQKTEYIKSNTIFKTVLASINNYKEIAKVFVDNRPQIVFHAAAYKHVPIQELHPWNAVKTNLGGTMNLVDLSDKYGIDKFVLVSTDKAVNPVNVMGATKRAAEKLIQSFNQESNTTFMAVRFGNVLGSSGSAIPTFQKQINNGGPITITHPEMTRYFMSIQEASQLILQCGALGKDGEIFLLEMGKPIRIVQMAKDLIRLSGLEPELDIPIVYTGLRPGEKLYEELQLLNEQKVTTSHSKIMILKDNQTQIPWHIFKQNSNSLLKAADDLDSDKIQSLLKQVLPTYRPRNFNDSLKNDPIFHTVKGEA